jgi:signal transduction histidine kinase
MTGGQELGPAIFFYLGWTLSETLLLTQFLKLFAKRVREVAQLRATIKNQAENGNKVESVKSNFLRNICHELRTPASSILGFSELLQESNLDSTQRGHVSVIKRCSEVLLGLTNDLLDLSKIDSRMLKVERHHYDFHKLHQEIKDMFELKCAKKGIELEIVLDKSIPRMAVGDSHRTRQVLMNLVGNAVKFTEKGKIKIEVQKDEQLPLYHWRVSDTGRGIPDSNIPHLFKSYYQGDPSIPRLYGGTGLGLMISKNLVELMGGEIGVTSQFGEGSSFTFSIPLRED